MGHIKKLVLQGFKSFARRTEIPFENAMNVIVGANGSGKSNVADALCFVLGRISIKSIRAAKAANLLFSGNKNYKGTNEASVELVFDNMDGEFAINTTEVSIKRIVRRNGLSIYKINNETKTRQELIELIAQAGIDPNGFNIVMQGDIMSLVKMGNDERRRIIEDVAGIAIYETRKQKSLSELEKTDEKIKEISAILREKNSYLKSLEKDRQDALNHQKLQESLKRNKATLISKTIKEKEKEVLSIEKIMDENRKDIETIRKKIKTRQEEINQLQEKVNKINKDIQLSTGEEQESLYRELSDLKGKQAGHEARKDNYENRLRENLDKENTSKNKLKILEKEISEIRIVSPEIKKQQEKLKEIQEKFDILEKKRRLFYVIKSELSTLENKKEEKNKRIIGYNKELEIIEKNINQIFEEIKHEKSHEKSSALKNETLKKIIEYKNEKIEIEKSTLEIEKRNAILEQAIKRESKLTQDIRGLDVCPTCKSKVTDEHRNYVVSNSSKMILSAEEELKDNTEKKKKNIARSEELYEIITKEERKTREIEIDLMKIKNAEEKKEEIKRIIENKKEQENTQTELNKKILELRQKFEELKNIEEEYDEERLKIQELSSYDTDVDTNVALKQRELERLKIELKTIARDSEETTIELKSVSEKFEEIKEILKIKEAEEQKLYEKSQKLFTTRDELQDKQKAIETDVMGMQHKIRIFEDKINSVNIQKAQHSAQLESLRFDFKEFETVELLEIPIEQARMKIQEIQIRLSQFGNINSKALEIYDQVKNACDQITEKMTTISTEKEKIMKIIGEIDKKKKKAFMQTLDALNILFTRNFSQLSKKGEVFLELDNKEDPFSGGLNILVKVGRGKMFDITSMSGGEKTLVALSLIFAIQEHKPYCFYIFDEIDAALDKHNSELLAALIKRYMLSGQYIVITHNDALISEATTLYGVSMQEGISKVISLKI